MSRRWASATRRRSAKIGRAERTLEKALDKLAERPKAGRRDADTFQLLRHCGEMRAILQELVDRLREGTDEDAVRAGAARLLSRLDETERQVDRTLMH